MTIWCMRIACWIPKATHTHSEYVIFNVFPLQKWLHKHASMLHYTYISRLANSWVQSVNKQMNINSLSYLRSLVTSLVIVWLHLLWCGHRLISLSSLSPRDSSYYNDSIVSASSVSCKIFLQRDSRCLFFLWFSLQVAQLIALNFPNHDIERKNIIQRARETRVLAATL
jgi:hypothetical protein